MDDEQQPAGPDDAWAPPPPPASPPSPPPPAPAASGFDGGLLPPASSPSWPPAVAAPGWPPGRATGGNGTTPPSAWDVPPAPVPLPSGPPSPWSMGGVADRPVPATWATATPYASPVAEKGRGSRRLAAVAAVAVLAVGGIGAALVLRRSGPSTQSSPEAAVTTFLGALEDGDLLGAAETLPKAERTLIVDVLGDLRDARVDDAPSDASLHSFDAYTLKIDGLTTNTEAITGDIAVVELTGGTYEASGDARKLPFGIGKAVGEMATDDPDMQTSDTVTGDIAELGAPVRLATVRDGEGWHVSLMYSAAEAARAAAGLPAPEPADRVAAVGADTPEDAVRQLFDAISAGQWRRLVELTPPDEMAALHDYGSMLLDQAPPPPDTPWLTIDKLELKSRDVRGGKAMEAKALAVTVRLDGEEMKLSVDDLGDGCYHLVADVPDQDPVDQTSCLKDGLKAADGSGPDLSSEQIAQLQTMSKMAGIVVVQVDGKWFVSPARTIGRLAPVFLTGFQLALRGLGGAFGDPMDTSGGFGSDGSLSDCGVDVADPSSDTSVGGGIGGGTDDPLCTPPVTTGS